MKTALCPGSFDPFHNGHLEIVETASRLFDHVVVAPMQNPTKADPLFSLEERQAMIAEAVSHLTNVSLGSFSTLTVDAARSVGADVIVKGLRRSADAENELMQAQMNKATAGIESLFIPCSSAYSFIASQYIRDFVRYGATDRVASLVPGPVFARLKEKFAL